VRRTLHYEGAFGQYLRDQRVPYVAVDEARKALLPGSGAGRRASLKSFDFVLYGQGANLLVDVKGRRLGRPSRTASGWRRSRLECWATQDDVDSLLEWERLFGEGFLGAFVFLYWCEEQPQMPLFEELFEHQGRWYAARAVLARQYAAAMKPRSPRWRTVDMPAAAFERASLPLRQALDGLALLDPPLQVASA
jgi:hypothetical protein